MEDITAIILAAGKGSRIGTPKLMLEINGESFLSVIINKISSAGIKRIICVINKEVYKWSKDNFQQYEIIINPEIEKGMLSSVYYGMKEIKETKGVMVFPVDHPFVEVETINELFISFNNNSDSIIKPRFESKSGHPVIIPFEILKTISEKDFDNGLNDYLIKSNCKETYVNVADKGILKNINTKEDL